jgi:antitoxin (DNA-binding transcriptional repressor) of toxin-antitoxin stability system
MPMPKTVSAAWAKANFPSLLKQAEAGKTTIVSRYKKPIAMIAPVVQSEDRRPKFGTGKGRIRIIDPHWADPMTDEEVDAFLEGRY